MSSLCTQFHIHAESKDTRTRIIYYEYDAKKYFISHSLTVTH